VRGGVGLKLGRKLLKGVAELECGIWRGGLWSTVCGLGDGGVWGGSVLWMEFFFGVYEVWGVGGIMKGGGGGVGE